MAVPFKTSVLALAGLTLLPAPGNAQAPTQPRPQTATASSGDVVVTARKANERQREARAFVRDVSATPYGGQFARWHVPICPAATGVAPDIAAHVVARIRAVARAAGAPLDKLDCAPNAFVTFTTDAHGLLGVMERKQPQLLRALELAEARALRASLAPVLWWSGTEIEGARGNPLQSVASVAVGPNGTGDAQLPSNDHTRYIDSYTSSIIATPTRAAIEDAVVLIDVTRGAGRRLDAVADYAAFAILAKIRPAAPQGAAPTILRLFAADPSDRPPGLTAFDRAYLAGLYAVAPDRTGAIQAGRIVEAIGTAER